MVKELQTLTEQLRSSDEELRRLAVVGFSGYPFAQIKDVLFCAMGDESWRVRKEAVDTLLAIPFSPNIAEALVEMLRSQDNAGMRNSAVEALERLGGIALPTLSHYINDEDQDVRKFVIDIMGVVRDPDTVPLLIKALADPDPNVCAAAAETLGKIGDARAVPHLLHALERPVLLLRYAILEALSKIGKPVPLAAVAPLASENFLKKAVFDCLGVIGDIEAIPLLMDGLTEKPRSIREAAAIALMKIKERLPEDICRASLALPLKNFADTPVVEGLVAALDTTDRGLKEAVITLLGMIGDTRAIGNLLHGCRDDRLRYQCLVAFKNMGEGGIRSLMEAYSSAEDDERCLIAYVCGEIGCRECAPQLREGMHDSYYLLRKVSVVATGKIGLSGLIGEIAYLLDDTEPEVRESAIEVLSRFAARDREAVQEIATRLSIADFQEKRRDAAILFAGLGDADKLHLLVKDESAMVRKTAISALGQVRSRSSVGHLVMALADEDTEVRIAAATALGAIGGKEVLEPLVLAIGDEDLWVKCAAVKSLGKLGNDALGPLMNVLDSEEGLVLVSALGALAELGSDEAFAGVKKALTNPDEDVVKAAMTMLASDGDGWVEEYWQTLLYHPHWDVRCCFVKELAAKWGKKSIPYLQAALCSEADDLVKGQIEELLDRLQ